MLPWTYGVTEGIAVLFALATAAAIGLVNGFITLRFNVPSFIATLGTLFIVRSGSRLITGAKPLKFNADETFLILLTGKIFGIIPAQFVWFLGFAAIAYLILDRHRIGNRFFAAVGVSLFGGRGAIVGIVLGAMILEMVKDVLILGRAPSFYLDVFIAAAIILAVIANTLAAKRY